MLSKDEPVLSFPEQLSQLNAWTVTIQQIQQWNKHFWTDKRVQFRRQKKKKKKLQIKGERYNFEHL